MANADSAGHGGHSTSVVLTSLAVNASIAVVKIAAAVFTHSGSMFAEAIHSCADCMNQVLLLIGLRQATVGPSERHPLGTGRASYFWSFLVALLLFVVGGAFSIHEGVEKTLHPEQLEHVPIAAGILGFSFIAETLALIQCVRELNKKKGKLTLMKYLEYTKDAELVVCTAENLADVLGLGLAGISLVLAMFVSPRFDGVGSVLVGIVLVAVSWFLARKVKSLLLGERADPEVEEHIHAAAREDARILEVLRIISVQQGPGEVMIAAKLRLNDSISCAEVVDAINAFEQRVRTRLPDVKWQFIEPDVVA